MTFLYKLTDGVCPKSYGMNVASMAGIQEKIVDRAEKIAEEFESSQRIKNVRLRLISAHNIS